MINYENFNGLKKNHSYQKFWKRSKLRIIINCNCSICFLFCSSVWFATLPLEASNIFVYYFAASFASFYDIPVWIQAVKIEQIWRFHDGSLVPGVFPISMSNNPEETHLREVRKIFDRWCMYLRMQILRRVSKNNVYLKTTDKDAQGENKITPQYSFDSMFVFIRSFIFMSSLS